MTLYFVAIVAGEQTRRPKLFALPVKSIIVWIAWRHLTYAKARRSIVVKQYERRLYVNFSNVRNSLMLWYVQALVE
jgi:hypothetical protein